MGRDSVHVMAESACLWRARMSDKRRPRVARQAAPGCNHPLRRYPKLRAAFANNIVCGKRVRIRQRRSPFQIPKSCNRQSRRVKLECDLQRT